jgi:hypothetical protein
MVSEFSPWLLDQSHVLEQNIMVVGRFYVEVF